MSWANSVMSVSMMVPNMLDSLTRFTNNIGNMMSLIYQYSCWFYFVYLQSQGLIPWTRRIYFVSKLLFNFFIYDFIMSNLVQTLVLPILHRIWTLVGLIVSGVGLESWMHNDIQLQNMRYAHFFSILFILMDIFHMFWDWPWTIEAPTRTY